MAGTITLTVDGGTALTPLSLSIEAGALTLAGQTVTASTNTFDYYIGPSGDNANAGTVAEPWDISALWLKTEVIGKRIGLLSGTYTLSTGMAGAAGDPEFGYVRIQGGTDNDNHTWVESVSPLGAVLTGGTTAYYYAILVPDTESYVTIKGIKIDDTTGGIRVRGTDCLVEDCEITNIYNPVNDNTGALNVGINTDRVTFRNCLIDTFDNSTSSDNASGLGPIFTARNVTVEYCTFKNGPCGINHKRGCGGITVRNCFFYNVAHPFRTPHLSSTDSGYYLPNYYYNNLFIVTGSANGGSSGETGMSLVTFEFYNNTIVLNGGTSGADGFWVLYGDAPASAASGKVYNNVWYTPSAASMSGSLLLAFEQSVDDAFSLMDYNAYGVSESKFAMHDYDGGASRSTTLSAWRTVLSSLSVSGEEAASFAGDPLFVDSGGTDPADFQLQAGSPCKDTGRIGGVSGGGTVDMGCWGGASQIGADI